MGRTQSFLIPWKSSIQMLLVGAFTMDGLYRGCVRKLHLCLMDIFILGIANLIGGLPIIFHMVMAILSYILLGLLPPVIYGLSFRKSDNRENKMVAVAAASLACIALLAIGKAHVKRPRAYIKTLMCYLTIGVSASGLSYVAGVLITRLLAHFGLFDQGASAPAPPSLVFPDAVGAGTAAWASY